MIRKLRREELDIVAAIWLDTNRNAHNFIPSQYWEGNFEAVQNMLLEAELYVYEERGAVQGFVGLDGDYIAGIFVQYGAQSRGIGKQLLDFVKCLHKRLTLSVYLQNKRAVAFYQREGFVVLREQIDETTGEREYQMAWEHGADR